MTPFPSPTAAEATSTLWPGIAWLFESTAPWWATGVFALLTALVTWMLTQFATNKERERQRQERVRTVGQQHAIAALKILRINLEGDLSDEHMQEVLDHIRLIPDADVREVISHISALGLMVPPSQSWDEGEQYPSLEMTRRRLMQAAVDGLEAWIREEPIAEKDRLSLVGIGKRAQWLNDRHPPLGAPSWDWPVRHWAEGKPETEVSDVPNP